MGDEPPNNWRRYGPYGPGSYVYDHEHDKNAHEAMRKEWESDVFTRLTALEKFKEQARGGFLTLSALLGGGLLVIALHIMGVNI